MLKNSKKYLELKRIAQEFVSSNIIDVVLFGSYAKGKTKASDIDVCIIFRNKIDLKIVKEFAAKSKAHTSSLLIDEFFTKPHALIRSLLFEGISLISGKKLNEIYNLSSFSLYTYNISKLKSSTKVRFVYLLKGRSGKGIVKNLGGKFLAPGCFLIPSEKDNEILDIMKQWKINFNRKTIMLIH